MPELSFQVTAVESVRRGLTPLLHFRLRVSSKTTEPIQALILNVQIQIQSPQRAYNDNEKERLVQIFGTPERWGQTLRNRLWTHANATSGAFTGETDLTLPVPCSYDLNLSGAKYFYALETGDIPLLFLFSGSVFYLTADGRLQVERISWNCECTYNLPVAEWKNLMEEHFPNSGWVMLQSETLQQLWAYQRRHGLGTWEQTIEHLLAGEKSAEPASLIA